MGYDWGMETKRDAFTESIATELRVAQARPKGMRPTNADISRTTGISAMAVGRYMNGERAIPVPSFIAICEALGVSPGGVLDAAIKNV